MPQDLSETYVRVFESIPEAERAFVRRVLIWLLGHSQAPWLPPESDWGINAKLLLSAVTYDLDGPPSRLKDSVPDCEYLQELCGCLITVRPMPRFEEKSDLGEPGAVVQQLQNYETHGIKNGGNFRPNNEGVAGDSDDFVSIAHYTVMEFLSSPHILNTSVSSFALSWELIAAEFTTSVLRQAVEADPLGAGTDWSQDREVYCLTLGCALKTSAVLMDPEKLELFTRYISPSEPHFTRFRAIQMRILDTGQPYFLLDLPSQIHNTSPQGLENAAAIVLALFLIPGGWPSGPKVFVPFFQKLLAGRSILQLLNTNLSVSFVAGNSMDFVERLCGSEIKGTVVEILQAREGKSRASHAIDLLQEIVQLYKEN